VGQTLDLAESLNVVLLTENRLRQLAFTQLFIRIYRLFACFRGVLSREAISHQRIFVRENSSANILAEQLPRFVRERLEARLSPPVGHAKRLFLAEGLQRETELCDTE
jgi:hypothetical protein